MIPWYLLSAFPHRQFHTLPGLLDSWAALPNSKPNACMPMQGGSLYHFYDGLWYDPAGRRTPDLPCERRTHYRLSQPDTVVFIKLIPHLRHQYTNTKYFLKMNGIMTLINWPLFLVSEFIVFCLNKPWTRLMSASLNFTRHDFQTNCSHSTFIDQLVA